MISGESISAYQSGLVLAGTTLAYPLITPTNTVTIADVTFTEIGSSLAVIDGTELPLLLDQAQHLLVISLINRL